MEVLGWKVWYDDGASFDSRRQPWAELPDDGVLIVMVYFDDGTRRIMEGSDYYFTAPGRSGTLYAQSDDAPGEILRRYPQAVLKRGRWTDEAMFRTTREEAYVWRYF